MRLSSPTYDDQMFDLDEEGLEELEALEFTLSQRAASTSTATKRRSLGDSDVEKKRQRSESDNGQGNQVQWNVKYVPPSTTAKGKERHLSPEPDSSPPKQQDDYSQWFEFDPTQTGTLPGFQKLSSVVASQQQPSDEALPGFASAATPLPSAAFSSAGRPSTLEPSKAALEAARRKMQEWAEKDKELEKPSESSAGIVGPAQAEPAADTRPPLRNLQNQAVVTAASGEFKPLSTPVKPTSVGKALAKPRGFKSPFIGAPSSTTLYPRTATIDSPSRQGTQTSMAAPTPSTRLQALVSSPAGMAPPIFQSPLRTGLSKRAPRTSFSTPFKAGMKPGEPGRQALPATPSSSKTKLMQTPTRSQASQSRRLNARPSRPTLQSSGLLPQRYSQEELERMNVDVTQLRQITPETAIYYAFHTELSSTPSSSFMPSTADSFGPGRALDELLRRGCSLTTKPWVDNHWSLILWKLAGMVCLDPENETTPAKRWTWDEVMRQLTFRYNRELQGGSRPAFRLITTGDASAALPMVLCVSNITWSEEHVKDGKLVPRFPDNIEVTDGWYRLRARVDEPLTRAAGKGLLKVGRKFAVVGAKLVSQKKEPAEVLEAYNSVHLQLCGNSTHLAPWHAKLGFQRSLYIASLRSLTADGGPVAVMDLVIEKAYAMAYLEFKTTDDGKTIREGPRNEADEREESEKWMDRRHAAESKLREALDKKWSMWEGWTERLEIISSGKFRPREDDTPPDHVEGLFDDLESNSAEANSSLFKRLSVMEAGYLAEFIRKKIELDRENAGQEIEAELSDVCPPRDVRNFRVLVVRDSRTGSKPCLRKAQLTVWDAQSLAFPDDGDGATFGEGQRYIVTNLVPSQRNAWMPLDAHVESQVFLNTRRDSRWRRVREASQ